MHGIPLRASIRAAVPPVSPVSGIATKEVKPCSERGFGGTPTPLEGENRSSFGLRVAAELLTEARRLGGSETCVYFIQADGEGGPIKVGIAGDPHRRLASLQTGNPAPLLLRGFYPGPSTLERVVHGAFADDRLEGEWFVGSEYLEAVADAFYEAAIYHGLAVMA